MRIIIVGDYKEGKTTMAALISKMLSEKGIPHELKDDTVNECLSPKIEHATEIFNRPYRVGEERKISVETFQIARSRKDSSYSIK